MLQARTAAIVVGTVVLALCCSKREAEAPQPNEPVAASEPPAPAIKEQQSAPPADSAWPGAVGGMGASAAQAPKGDQAAEKKAASAPAAPRAEAKADDESFNLGSEKAGPARSAASEPRAKSTGEERAKADADELAQWRRSVALLEQSFEQFEDAIELTTPDCPAADKFRQTVCTLAERICSLEEQVPTSIKRRCDDGKQRCEQAGQKYRARCDKE